MSGRAGKLVASIAYPTAMMFRYPGTLRALIRPHMRIAYLSLLLAACTGGERAESGQCPAGEVCSTETPNGLHFVGADSSDGAFGKLSAPPATAIGGTQRITIQYDPGTGIQRDLDLPYEADDDGGLGVKIDMQEGANVTLRGAGSRTNYLRIVEAGSDLLMDRKEMTGASLMSISLVQTGFEVLPDGAQIAYAPGHIKVGVALYGQVQSGSSPSLQRIVDQSMGLVSSGGSRAAWDAVEFDQDEEKTLTVGVTAGDKPQALLPLEVYATADSIEPIDPQTTIPANGSATLCFAANTSDYVVLGFQWQFTIDGAATDASIVAPNCVVVAANKPSGQIEVAASAGGRSTTVDVTIGQSAVRVPTKTGRDMGTTAGERASL